MTNLEPLPALRELTALIVEANPEIMEEEAVLCGDCLMDSYPDRLPACESCWKANEGNCRSIALPDVLISLMKAGCYFTFNHNFRLAVVDKHNIDHGSVEFLPEYPLDDQDPEVHSFLLSLLSPSKGN